MLASELANRFDRSAVAQSAPRRPHTASSLHAVQLCARVTFCLLDALLARFVNLSAYFKLLDFLLLLHKLYVLSA